MSGCPFRNFEDCPEHNKKGGCSLWLSYSTNGSTTEAQVEGCSLVLTPMLLIQQVNNLAVVASETSKVAEEVSASRVENIKIYEANRYQLLSLANGKKELIQPCYSNSIELRRGGVQKIFRVTGFIKRAVKPLPLGRGYKVVC